MTEKLPTSQYIFVDRRKTGRGKSLGNRQRLLRRIKDAIRDSKPQDIDAGGVKAAGSGASPKANTNAVKVTKTSLHEPTFHYARNTGNHDVVLIGNDEYERGDNFPMNGGGGEGNGEGQAGHGENGEDDFIVNVSREEFFNVFFEDCELPDLQDTSEKELPELMPKHAGFQREGNPAQLSVIRSYKNALPRRKALTTEARAELEELEEELARLLVTVETPNPDDEVSALELRVAEIEVRIGELRSKIKNVPFFEKLDLRYNKKEKVLVKSADAVFCMIMDVSGSMGEEKKRIARKFFSLQYAFIKKKYPQTDLVFIAHTDDSVEMTEEEFFSTRLSGGTTVSPAYELLLQILNARYDSKNTNIYLSQASDGDNEPMDNAHIRPALEESSLLAKLRHMSYTQVGQSFAAGYGGIYGGSLWTALSSVANDTKKISMVKIQNEEDVFEAFHSVYKKKTVTKR